MKRISSNIHRIKIYYTKNRITAHPSFLNKGVILKEAEKILNISPEKVAMAGNNVIDLPMMNPELGKYLICPSNADEEV